MNTTQIGRRDFLKTAGLTTTGFLLGGCQTSKTTSGGKDRPNVVVIFTDDQRWDCVGIMPKPLLG
ncbi:MAG: twin-arginine translocation signal domain-containing protein, partial [Planctomycetota bacterium]